MPEVAAATAVATAPGKHETDGAASSPQPVHPLQQRWQSVRLQIELDKRVLNACRAGFEQCPKSAKSFLGILERAAAKHGLAQIGEVNRSVNLALRPMTDAALYGVEEYWASPLTSFERGAGDCEDYAIAKYVALREIGYAAEDVRVVAVRNHAANENHAVVWVRYDDRWLVLDNQRLPMLDNVQLASQMTPLHMIEDDAPLQLASAVPGAAAY